MEIACCDFFFLEGHFEWDSIPYIFENSFLKIVPVINAFLDCVFDFFSSSPFLVARINLEGEKFDNQSVLIVFFLQLSLRQANTHTHT